MDDIAKKLANNKTLIVFEISLDNKDIFQSEINYLINGFEVIGLESIKNINQIIELVDARAEMPLALGLKVYCQKIKDGIIDSINNNEPVSFVVPLKRNNVSYSFMASFSKNEDKLNAVFLHLINNSFSTDVDDLAANTFKDSLTGLFNRYTLKRHISTHKQNGYLCLFDLNKFKEVNDTYGHKAGDDVLVAVANYLVLNSSSKEIYYRISGDEFMILFLVNDLDYVKETISKISIFMSELKDNELKKYPGIECSASFGVLELLYRNGISDIPHETQIKLVDLAMYQAKKSHKMIHLISDEDANEIIKRGDLDDRLAKLSKNRS